MADSDESATFKHKTVLEIMKTAFQDKDKTKEAASRCVHHAQLQKGDNVELEHVQKILPQLLLDFS